jgi:hypothetical protein
VRNASRRVKPEPWRENVGDIAQNEFHAKMPRRKAQRLLRKAVVSYFIHCAFAPLREIRFLLRHLGFYAEAAKKAFVAKKDFS